ncbi:MAG: hypothetical protein KAR45_22000, partial [Desulfobacteraceae bacterium]|nr:hypothetical protein [Desulfobacteraceae bacterium]
KHKILAMLSTSDLRKIWCYTKDGHYLGEAYPVQALHPMATLFGDQVSIDQVTAHNKRLGRLKKQTRQNLAELGITHESQDALNILPFTQKAPILPGVVDNYSIPEKTTAISEKENKRLEKIMAQAELENEMPPEIPKPKYWDSDLEHYEWCFKLIFEHGQKPCPEDKKFMNHFELLLEFEHYRQRFEDLKLIYN